MILGVDEVGRGCWAGPLVVGAVIMEPPTDVELKDSKLLTPKRRMQLAYYIRRHAHWVGIGWVSAKQIDVIGLGPALRLATARALHGMPDGHDIIIDGSIKLVEHPRATTLVKADMLIPAVSAASIIAKVARDTYMHTAHRVFPKHGFVRHVGYGTPEHRKNLIEYGPTPLHRLTYAPLGEWQPKNAAPPQRLPAKNSSGNKAEDKAAEYLKQHGFTLLARNWKTKQCEIDIIAAKEGTVYFVEVKYRKTASHGRGIDFITQKKLQQMSFAAESWAHSAHWHGLRCLAAIEVSGFDFAMTRFETEIHADLPVRAQTRQFGL